ncbi:isoleucyl-tRNA synthetase [Beutenbergia cavernae DSM 12333]|uniref:Isoleucine--tRNA ligase n=1 Tax=Beutenbergia cavernae (strain ATCC BAA-8 / DSM 12333 / CCUG 43141 / JCM 11478 / NBRC 16432 / NCIMB 13614 / HKI 0122) TaxID=471853 RepID=C5BXD0_BEUC1|nr:isoleucine--tRNA ligase [Beutenbergia cavernae]ACQ80813.1 isoleucyl-tRNA synthetase [Beutenbergia cavernae DSM 12333]
MAETPAAGAHRHYPRHTPTSGVAASPDLPQLERDVLAFWADDDTFRASIAQRPAGENGSNEFVFYDGPPFANGLPHYGHLLTGYVKDVVPRYRTMRGKHVERRFGWDTHGLPAELEAERLLGITDKSQIEELGIEAFNKECRESVLRYTREWEEYVTRQARWVDFENDYKTLDPTYMESVIWAFKELYDKGLAYEGYRVLPYCWRDQTPLSNHELRMDDDVYRMRQDPAVTVGLRLESGEIALVWTTTPWTLPSNLAIVVGRDIEYVVVTSDTTGTTERYVLAAARLPAYARELKNEGVDDVAEQVVERLTGAELLGRSYTPPFSYYLGRENAFRVVDADFVTTEDGTGLVHTAGAFGEDDKVVTDREGIESVMPVGPDGAFTEPVTEYAGQLVFDANSQIIADLKAATRGEAAHSVTPGTVLLRHETYDHSYPHCWRCKNPLIYKGVESWFIRVSAFRDRMVELNQEITWVPEHLKDGQFGKWLEGARDWSISRKRYWGTPIPVWTSDDPEHPRIDVYGSIAQLEADFGVPVEDLHRPFIDRLTRPNPDDPTGRSTMRRIPDVMDVWFDSGSMPFAQVHYPFENTEWFEHHFPGDFIVEYIGQTRGWFYLLHVLSTALFDRPAFRTCVSHGIILGDDGRKASKSLRNFPDPMRMFDAYGSDAVRWSLMSSPVLRGGNLVVAEEAIRTEVRGVLLPLWNTWYFFSLYANTVDDGAGIDVRPPSPSEVAGLADMDRYVLARTRSLVERVTDALEVYDIARACTAVRDHLDVVTNWYVRTSRQRFWDEDAGAYGTLYTVLEVLTRLMAPLAPMVAEEVWRGLTGGRSVHLTDWPALDADAGVDPTAAALVADDDLVAAMDRAREVVSTAHALRKANKLRVRQPLRRLTVVVDDVAALEPFAELIAGEVNLREVACEDIASDAAQQHGVFTKLTVDARAAGPRLGRDVQRAIAGARAGDWETVQEDGRDVVVAGGVRLEDGEYTTSTQVSDALGDSVAAGVLPGGGFVVLDLELDDDLLGEGYARDVVRVVQDERKAAGLHVADRITLRLAVPAEWAQAVADRSDFIGAETLAVDVTVDAVAPGTVDVVGVELARLEGGAR